MRVLVTGVKGQLGYHVVQELEKKNHTAIGVDIEGNGYYRCGGNPQSDRSGQC